VSHFIAGFLDLAVSLRAADFLHMSFWRAAGGGPLQRAAGRCSLPRMKGARLAGGCVLLIAATCLEAHAHLERSVPADGSVLSAAPAQLVLQFSEAAQLATLAIARDGGAPRKLTALPETAQPRIVIALPALPAGDYVVSWRAVGVDGHVVPGRIHFTVNR
jgi:copper resistance protein C